MIQGISNLSVKERSTTLFRLVDIAVIVIMLLLTTVLYGVEFDKDYQLLLVVSLSIFTFLASSVQLYRELALNEFTQRVLLIFAVLSITSLLMILVLFLMKETELYSRVVISFWFISSFLGLVAWRLAYRAIRRRHFYQGKNLKKVAIIGMTTAGLKLAGEIENCEELGVKCIGFFDDREVDRLEGNPERLVGRVDLALEMAQRNEIDCLYLCLPLKAEERIAEIIHILGDTTVNVHIVPNFLLNNLMNGSVGKIGSMDTISVFESPISGIKDFYKRSFDFIFSLCALIGISPFLLMIALAVKLTSHGPILFRQDRYGLDGKRIGVYKFRSMTVTENGTEVTQATKNDSRITKVGAFLRKTSLDELPQFFNVLMGDMSVVGPRPHAVAHNEEYRKRVDYYMLRHKVRPGITGWAQINGWRGETDTIEKMEKRVEYDLDYIRHWTIWFDIKIIFWTIFKGFINKNAY
ncbi:MAG: putative colanic acid biosysnthesis UDP-glucose lipid carrier transferase [Thiomicrorhabdus sp.]|nr:MAG: putative colanic acid biosysnthesis UDP-glucose lipid carrier transferase [Thiomicrorhabdus sp.]